MIQEVSEALAVMLICGQVPPILANRPETARYYIGQGVVDPAGLQHLYHRLRRPVGLGTTTEA